MILTRRKALLGSLAAFVAAPAIVRVASIMPVRVAPQPVVVGVDLAPGLSTASLRMWAMISGQWVSVEAVEWVRDATEVRGVASLGAAFGPVASANL